MSWPIRKEKESSSLSRLTMSSTSTPSSATNTLPIRTLPIVEQWDCFACGQCCKGHTVVLDASETRRLSEQGWARHPDFKGVAVTQQVGLLGGPTALAQRPDGSCVFLTDEGLCRIHAEHGEAAKPWACRLFPFQLIPVGDHLRLTMRRTCPSAADNKGKVLKEHLGLVRELAPHALPEKLESLAAPGIVSRRSHPWADVRRVTDHFERIMLDERFPPVRRLLHLVRLCGHLAECRLGRVKGKALVDLVEVLATAASKEVNELLRERAEPSRTARILFRQTAGEYVRFHPNLGDRPSFAKRWELLRAAVRIARGRGEVPRVHPDMPVARFEDLERPLGGLLAEVVGPLNAYLEAMTASLQYCGAGRFGWSVVDGFRALALAFPVGLWVLRWLSQGREPTREDMIRTVCILDRSHFYPLLSGYRHRKRLDVLARQRGLERLIVWYAR
ncbi:Flagellin N-methylase [Planctomycetes bacterium Pan216]|uniref:Flagellin N-methylase n=1 Tax=Kolteria novifilia TaxID=2527975 RepID=A0A518AZQ1_9BACT|nr:Flagellin N-methylase [Planctomycetes bacterium Pan216]